MFDLAATFLGFTCDTEASALVLGENLEMICIRVEAAHGRLGQDKEIGGGGHMTFWGTIRNALELAQNRAGEATVTTLKTQVSKID